MCELRHSTQQMMTFYSHPGWKIVKRRNLSKRYREEYIAPASRNPTKDTWLFVTKKYEGAIKHIGWALAWAGHARIRFVKPPRNATHYDDGRKRKRWLQCIDELLRKMIRVAGGSSYRYWISHNTYKHRTETYPLRCWGMIVVWRWQTNRMAPI